MSRCSQALCEWCTEKHTAENRRRKLEASTAMYAWRDKAKPRQKSG